MRNTTPSRADDALNLHDSIFGIFLSKEKLKIENPEKYLEQKAKIYFEEINKTARISTLTRFKKKCQKLRNHSLYWIKLNKFINHFWMPISEPFY